MNKCETCKFWSESCARSIGCGPMEALCLNPASKNKGKYTEETETCSAFEEGSPIDM